MQESIARRHVVRKELGFSPCMARPSRNASPEEIVSSSRRFFVSSRADAGRSLLQSERKATLFIDVLREYVKKKKFEVVDFVVMPNHVHVILTVGPDMTIERAVGLIKGRFSYRLKDEFGYMGEVWQPGFSEERIDTLEALRRCPQYIAANPVKAGLAKDPDEYPYCFQCLARKKTRG